jgi:NADH:ubiquinone oxidoreductase subunit H
VPLGYIVFIDLNFSILLLIAIHMINNVFSIFLIGCFLFTSCFIYLAAMRALFFSIITEGAFAVSLYNFYILDFFSFFSIKNIAINQLFIQNIFFVGLIFFFIFVIIILLDGMRIPFDYLECESELVAGIITEFSGFFFVLYSLMEINHLLLSSLLIVAMCFGGIFMTLKSLLIILIVFLFPRVLGCRLKITTAQTFVLVFLFSMSFILFL